MYRSVPRKRSRLVCFVPTLYKGEASVLNSPAYGARIVWTSLPSMQGVALLHKKSKPESRTSRTLCRVSVGRSSTAVGRFRRRAHAG